MTILEHGTKEVDNSLRLVRHNGEGHLMVVRGDAIVADESDGTWARCAKLAAQIPANSQVAIIGGGMGVLARILRRPVTVFEIEPALEPYSNAAKFIVGDWRKTLPGFKFDVIVYDVGDAPDVELLRGSLAVNGLLLGV